VEHPGQPPSPTSDDAAAEVYAAQLGRTVDRLRSLAITRLAAPFEPESPRADAARALAQRLADTAATLEGEPRRTLPRLADGAVGDQVAVCGGDLLEAASTRLGDPAVVPLLATLADDLLDLRRRL
jgi:hypothetical protein